MDVFQFHILILAFFHSTIDSKLLIYKLIYSQLWDKQKPIPCNSIIEIKDIWVWIDMRLSKWWQDCFILWVSWTCNNNLYCDSLPHQKQHLVIKSYQGNNGNSMLLIFFMTHCPSKARVIQLSESLSFTKSLSLLLHVCPLLFRHHNYSHIDI